MDGIGGIEHNIIEALGSGPKTAWWLTRNLGLHEKEKCWIDRAIADVIYNGFVEERGLEYLYPQTDRRDGVRRKRGKRLKTWTETRRYYALTDVGRVLLPLKDLLRLGVV